MNTTTQQDIAIMRYTTSTPYLEMTGWVTDSTPLIPTLSTELTMQLELTLGMAAIVKLVVPMALADNFSSYNRLYTVDVEFTEEGLVLKRLSQKGQSIERYGYLLLPG